VLNLDGQASRVAVVRSEGSESVHGDEGGSPSVSVPRSDLTACVRYLAHELRNSLSAATGWVRVLRQTGVPEGMTKAVEAIERNLNLHTMQMDDLLDAVAIGSGRPLSVASPIQIAPAIAQAQNDVAAVAQRREVRVEIAQSDQAPSVAIDQDRLRRMVSALLRAAVETVPARSMVSLRTVATATGVDIRVQDSSQTPGPVDMPVNLQLVAVLAEAHGGHLTAFGSDRGAPTAFSLELPRG
jgi:signal transduction histidine kinase